MRRVKVLLLIAAVIAVATLLVIQQRKIQHLQAVEAEQTAQLEVLVPKCDKLDKENQRLRAANEKNQAASAAEVEELLRLRGEATRLRRDLASATNRAATPATPPRPAPAALAPAAPRFETYTGAVHASLPVGHTLVMGGWPMAPGKRTLALFTPEPGAKDDPRSIYLRGQILQLPESLLASPAWQQFLAVTRDSGVNGTFTPEQARQFLQALKQTEGVDFLTSPLLATTSGTEGIIRIGQENGAGITTSLLPVLSGDGQTIDLTVSNAFQQLPGAPK